MMCEAYSDNAGEAPEVDDDYDRDLGDVTFSKHADLLVSLCLDFVATWTGYHELDLQALNKALDVFESALQFLEVIQTADRTMGQIVLLKAKEVKLSATVRVLEDE